MNSPRWYHAVNTLVNEFLSTRNNLYEIIGSTQILQIRYPNQSRTYQQEEERAREELELLENNFKNEIERIQENMRRTI